MKWLIARIRYAWETMRMRWIGRKLGRKTGLDINGAFKRGEAARDRAYGRALLVDPTDQEAALQAGEDAMTAQFADSLSVRRKRLPRVLCVTRQKRHATPSARGRAGRSGR